MAEPVALQSRPPQPMTLADMVNMAGAIQNYQQRAATNPLALEQQKYQTQTAGQLARTGEINLGVSEQQNKERPLLQEFFSDPNNFTTDGQYDSRKALIGVSKIAPLTGPEYLKNLAGTMQAQSQESEAALKAKQAFFQMNDAQRTNFYGHVRNGASSLLDLLSSKEPITAKTIEDKLTSQMKAGGATPDMIALEVAGIPKTGTQAEYKAYLAKHATKALETQAQLEKLFPSATMVSLGGQVTPVTLANEALSGVKPGTPVGQSLATSAGPGSFQTVNGITYKVGPNGELLNPSAASSVNLYSGGSTTAGNAAPLGVNAPPAAGPSTVNKPPVAKPTGNEPPKAPLVIEDMPVSKTGLRQMNDQQKTRYDNGQKLFTEASNANQTAADQGVVLNSIKQNLQQAQSSKPGQLLRKGGKWLAGNEQLDTLVKNLAQNQILQAKIMGVDSVNAERTSAIANGSEDIDPKALAKIIQTTEATKSAVQMYNQGLSAYKQRDPLNSAIHADRFQQAWKDNYDPRIFMVENINNSNMTDEQKKEALKNIRGIATPAELKQLQQKASNIRRLQTGNF